MVVVVGMRRAGRRRGGSAAAAGGRTVLHLLLLPSWPGLQPAARPSCPGRLGQQQDEEEGCDRGCGGTHFRAQCKAVRVYLMLRLTTDTTRRGAEPWRCLVVRVVGGKKCAAALLCWEEGKRGMGVCCEGQRGVLWLRKKGGREEARRERQEEGVSLQMARSVKPPTPQNPKQPI